MREQIQLLAADLRQNRKESQKRFRDSGMCELLKIIFYIWLFLNVIIPAAFLLLFLINP